MSQIDDFLLLTEFDGKTFPTKFVERDDLLKIGAVGNGSSLLTRSSLAKKYELEIIREGVYDSSPIKKARILKPKEIENTFSQTIPPRVKQELLSKSCLILGTSNPEIDHKDGRKQKTAIELDEFQPLSKAANDAKRQFCKICKRTNKRFDAKQLYYPISFTYGDENYNDEIGCKGCFWYDIKDFREHLTLKIN